MIGTILNDRYKIQSEIGRGGMGTVYRAEDTLLERPVAVKVVSTSVLGTEGRSRLLQEARATARLNHPNIVAVYDVGQVELAGQKGQSSYIVMELVEGQTLRESNPQDLDQIVDLTGHICEALGAAHQQGIIHRDLKPENVTVAQGNTVKLMDFGLARISGQTRLTQEGTLMGTLSYLAPEVILGQEAQPRSDLYALGVMLYEMCAGRPPFKADNLTAVISQHLHAPVVPPSAYNQRLPAALDRLIVQLLSKRPEDRPPSAEAVRAALDEIPTAGAVPQMPVPVSQLDRLVRGRMVGREAEFAEAAALWAESAAGNGQLLLISGDPGIGKTRLVKELIAYAEISGGKALVGHCYAQERTPYGPITQMIQASLDGGFNLDLPESVLAALLTLSPELRLEFPRIPANERLDPDEEQQRLFDSIITWFSAVNKGGELLLVIEDIHWADSGSLALLRYLARRLSRRRALVVATYREVELDEALPFRELLTDLNRERLATRIKLSRLNKERTRDLLTALFDEEITPEFLEGIYRETEGNPLFIEEVCKSLVDNGKLVYEGGRWQRPADVLELEIPQGIRLTIQSRLGKLSDEEQNTLQLAALLGREFEYDLLAAVGDLDEDQLIDALEDAERAQIIEEVRHSAAGATPSFSFTHALIHSTLLSNLSTLRRQRLQRQVALALEVNFPERQKELAPVLGRYFAEAGDGEKGVAYLLSAGDSAREVFAYEEAIEAYEQALLFLKEWGDHERTARTFMKLGLTYHNIFDFDSARKAYELGFTEWQQTAESGSLDIAPRRQAPHPFRAVSSNDPLSFDVAFVSDGWSFWCIIQLFSGLLQLTADDELVPDVAQSWEVLDQGRTYVFHLRNDVRWSDGRPVTAADFEYAWKRALHPDNDQGLTEMLFDIEGAQAFKNGLLENPDDLGIRATDEYTLLVNLEYPSSYFLQLMATAVSMPVPKHIVERYGLAWAQPENLVTNGPFTLKSLQPGQSMVFERYKDYHGRLKGNLSLVDFKVVQGEVALEMYDRDEIDILYPYFNLSLEDGRRAIQHHPDDYISVPNPMTTFLAFDVRKPPFDDPKVRQALALAMDRETLANQQTQGLVFPAGGGFVPPGVVGHVSGIALAYDPALARQKLAEAGYPGGRGLPSIEGICSLWGGLPKISNYLTAGWKTNLGLQLSFEYLESFDEINDRLTNDPPNMWLGGWLADYPDPDSFLRYGSWLRIGGWHNEKYEALVEDARRIADQDQRMAMYRQAEQILVEEAPVVPLHYGRLHVLVKPWLPGLPASMINGNILKDIIIEEH